MRAYDTPTKYKSRYEKAIKGELSPRQAIKVFCFQCMGWNSAEANRCNTYNCPLWQYSPAATISINAPESGQTAAELQEAGKGV